MCNNFKMQASSTAGAMLAFVLVGTVLIQGIQSKKGSLTQKAEEDIQSMHAKMAELDAVLKELKSVVPEGQEDPDPENLDWSKLEKVMNMLSTQFNDQQDGEVFGKLKNLNEEIAKDIEQGKQAQQQAKKLEANMKKLNKTNKSEL